MTINVPEICGADTISRDAGRKVRELILSGWHHDTIALIFGGKTVGSVSFFDEAIGLLLKRGGRSIEEVRKKLKFPDLTPADRTLLDYVVTTRLKEVEHQA